MVTLIVLELLGVTAIGLVIASNREIFRRIPSGPQLSALECGYYAIGIVSAVISWYFNVHYVSQYSPGWQNPFSSPGGFSEYFRLMFPNPAASAVMQDYLIANLVLLPLFTIAHGIRRGVRRPWLYFVSSLFITFTFAWAFYLATIDRQRRLAGRANWS